MSRSSPRRVPPGLAALFSPTSVDQFLAQHWDRAPLVRHGALARLGPLSDLEDFADFSRWYRQRGNSIAAALHRDGRYRRIGVDRAQAAMLWEVGATLSFNGVHGQSPQLARWVRALARDVGATATMSHANIYLSPRGAGVAKHYDAHPVIVVQVTGVKAWKLAPSHDKTPLESCSDPPAPSMPRASLAVTMRPGSVLYVPPAWWHETRAVEASLSVSVGLRAPRWLDVVRDGVAEALGPEERWRGFAWRGGADAMNGEARAVVEAATLPTRGPSHASRGAAARPQSRR